METKTMLLWAALWCGALNAQDLPTNDALQHALQLAELQHDEAAALAALNVILADGDAPGAVRRRALLEVGRLARRQGEEAAARRVFARVAKGDDAVAQHARALLEQDPQDAARTAALRERASVALGRYQTNPGDAQSLRDLLWFGDTAAELLVRILDAPDGASRDRYSTLMRALWAIDSDVARAFLARKLEDPDAGVRLWVVGGLQEARGVSDATRELARRALRDSNGDVVRLAIGNPSLWTPLELAPWIADPRVDVRLAALSALNTSTMGWLNSTQQRSEPDRQLVPRTIVSHLHVPLAATDPGEFRAAMGLLKSMTPYCAEARTLLLAHVTQVEYGRVSDWYEDPHFAGENENATRIAELVGQLGPLRDWNRASPAQQCVATLAQLYLLKSENWQHGALDAVATIVSAGYVSVPGNWLEKNAGPADAPRLATVLVANSRQNPDLVNWLAGRDLPAAAFEPLRDAFAARGDFADAAPPLLRAIGRTGHPDAVAFLVDAAANDSTLADAVGVALAFAGTRQNDSATRDAMRAALFACPEGAQIESSTRAARALFAQLVRMGDVAVFDDPTAIRTRIGAPCNLYQVPVAVGWGDLSMIGLGSWLTLRGDVDGTIRSWHGYGAEDLARIWTRLLGPDTRDGVRSRWSSDWDTVDSLLDAAVADRARLPKPLLIALANAFTARAADATSTENWTISASHALGRLVNPALRAAWPGDADVDAALTTLAAQLWTSPNATLRDTAVTGVPAPLDATNRAHLVALLGDPDPTIASRAWSTLVERFAIPVDAAMVRAGLSSETEHVRGIALDQANPSADGTLDLLRGALRDPSALARIAACRALGKSLSLDAVADLLDALKDSDPTVRAAATNALQAIRFYHDEKAHWDRVFADRSGLTTGGAAEALLAQAKPGNDAATRALAIRALGVLGAPETTPFLIDWTKDADATVAAAAREALGRILDRGK